MSNFNDEDLIGFELRMLRFGTNISKHFYNYWVPRNVNKVKRKKEKKIYISKGNQDWSLFLSIIRNVWQVTC